MKILYTLAIAATLATAGDDMSWMYQEDILTAGKPYSIGSSKNQFTIEDHCVQPIKPKQLNDNRDVHRINAALHTYQSCITKFQRKYTEMYNKERDQKKRHVIAKALEKSQRDWMRFASKDDVEQNQKILATFETLSLGYEPPQKQPPKK